MSLRGHAPLGGRSELSGFGHRRARCTATSGRSFLETGIGSAHTDKHSMPAS